MSAAPEYDTRYLAGIGHFNRGEYFEAHEVWEGLWRDCAAADRLFYQSLIQAAVALYHWSNGNRVGAIFYGGGVERTIPARGGRVQVLRLINDRELMGAYVNRGLFGMLAWAIAGAVSLLSLALIAITVLGWLGVNLGG